MLRRGWIATACLAVVVPVSTAGCDQYDRPADDQPTSGRYGACGEPPSVPKPDGGEYECAFVEHFESDVLDRDDWLVQETSFSGMTTGNHDCFIDDPDNIALADGVLRLTSKVEPAPFTCPNPTGAFPATTTAATITTRDRFAQTYGRFEFRARFPEHRGPGLHSALWLYPQRDAYGPWPHSGEVDVAEWFSAEPDRVYPSVHYQGEDPKLSTGYECDVSTASTDFHTYAVDWSPTSMRFSYDGELCYEHRWTPAPPVTPPQPFDHPFYVVLTQQFGGAWNAVDPTTPDSGTLLVDWVKVWR